MSDTNKLIQLGLYFLEGKKETLGIDSLITLQERFIAKKWLLFGNLLPSLLEKHLDLREEMCD